MKRLVLFLFSISLWSMDLSPIGAPTGGGCQVMDKGYFVLCYQPDWKIPQWVVEHLTAKQIGDTTAKRVDKFGPNRSLPVGIRSELDDYKGSGFDRGHQAPAGDYRWSKEAMLITFLLDNMAPQYPAMNRGPWRDLEAAARSLTAAHGETWIVTGPVAGVGVVQRVGRNGVLVPGAFFKLVLCVHPGKKEVFAFLMPNVQAPVNFPDGYHTSLSRIEKLTGLTFFTALPPAERSLLETAENPFPDLKPLPADRDQAKKIKKQKHP